MCYTIMEVLFYRTKVADNKNSCNFSTAFLIVYEPVHTTSLAVCSVSVEISRRPNLILASCRYALPVCYTLCNKTDEVLVSLK